MKKNDAKNGIAVHANGNDHRVDWDGAKVLEQEPRYWRRRILEAMHIHRRRQTSNLDCGLTLDGIWTPFLER